MASRGVNLTGLSLAQPSVFEISSQESLASVLEPAVKRVLDLLATTKPEKYGWITEWSDEIYTICNGLLQGFFLSKYSASFSETFYGLKRVSLNKKGTDISLSTTQKICSFVCLVVLPYIGKKLEKLEERHKDKKVKPSQTSDRDVYLVKGYKLFRIVNEALVMYHYVLYISGRSKYPTVTLRLLRATLTYSHVHETLSIIQLLKKIGSGTFSMGDGYNLFKLSFVNVLEVAAFFVQFAKWNSENYTKSFTALPKPPPPSVKNAEHVPEMASRYKGLCPICYKTYKHPTTLLTSGYIFCYQCILYEIQKYGKCPVTNYPSEENDLVRLYTQA